MGRRGGNLRSWCASRVAVLLPIAAAAQSPPAAPPVAQRVELSSSDLELLRELDLLRDLELLEQWDPAEDLPIPLAPEAGAEEVGR